MPEFFFGILNLVTKHGLSNEACVPTGHGASAVHTDAGADPDVDGTVTS